jgi:hypothetical protein
MRARDSTMSAMRRLFLIALMTALCAACTGGRFALRTNGSGQIAVSSAVPHDPQLLKFPELAKQHTGHGAAAFVGYYFDAVNWAVATTDWRPVQQITDPACSACAEFQRLEQRRAVYQRLRHERIVIESAMVVYVRSSSGERYGVDTEIHMSGGPLSRAAGSHLRLTVWLDWHDGRWAVSSLEANA